MEERYALLAKAGVRHLSQYNSLGRDTILDRVKPETDEEAEKISNMSKIAIRKNKESVNIN